MLVVAFLCYYAAGVFYNSSFQFATILKMLAALEKKCFALKTDVRKDNQTKSTT